jgi:hypothetical protein
MRSFETAALTLAISFVFVTDVNALDQPEIVDGTVRGELAGQLDDQMKKLLWQESRRRPSRPADAHDRVGGNRDLLVTIRHPIARAVV